MAETISAEGMSKLGMLRPMEPQCWYCLATCSTKGDYAATSLLCNVRYWRGLSCYLSAMQCAVLRKDILLPGEVLQASRSLEHLDLGWNNIGAGSPLHPEIQCKKPHFSTTCTRNAVSCI
eukprot:3135966-Rhodomonas_salina.2